MYDSIMVPCPRCGTKTPFQSKSGPCLLDSFELEEAPADVLEDVMRHGPATCAKCGTTYGVISAKSVKWPPPDPDMKDETVTYEVVGDEVLEEFLRNAAAAIDSDNFLGYLSSVCQCHHYIASMAIELQQRRAGANPSRIVETTLKMPKDKG